MSPSTPVAHHPAPSSPLIHPPQDQTAGPQLRDASSTKASTRTRRTSSRCRSRYACGSRAGEEKQEENTNSRLEPQLLHRSRGSADFLPLTVYKTFGGEKNNKTSFFPTLGGRGKGSAVTAEQCLHLDSL